MLDLEERTETERLDPHTKFKLFEFENTIGPSVSIPPALMTHKRATSHSRQKLHSNDSGNADESDFSSSSTTDRSTTDRLPLLITNSALTQAISQVQIPMDGWAPLYIFKLFVVLVEPPPALDLSAIEGLHDYLTQLLVKLTGLVENGIRGIASHCWWALLGKCSTPNFSQI